MSSKHTPGPWTAHAEPCRGLRTDGNGVVTAPCGDGVFVIAVPTLNEYRREECEANARLIAAAPELREALQAARPWLAVQRDDDAGRMVLGMIDAALAKATGEETP